MLQTLEPRTYQAGITSSRSGDTFTINCTSGADVLSLHLNSAGMVTVDSLSPSGASTHLSDTPFAGLSAIKINGGSGRDEVRLDFILHAHTHTTSIETRRIYIKNGTKLTADFSTVPLEGVYGDSTKKWLARFQPQLDIDSQTRASANVIFIGDSMIERLVSTGASYWTNWFLPRKSVNLGLTGDTTGNLLYRIEKGVLDGYHPKVVVLEVGTNNTDRTDDINSTLLGIKAVTRAISARLPDAKILITSIFPKRTDSENAAITSIDSRLASWDDGTHLQYLNLYNYFAGNPVHEEYYQPADVHLSKAGYQLWSRKLVYWIDQVE